MRPSASIYRAVLRAVRGDRDAAEMTRTFQEVLDEARRRGRLAGLWTVATEFADLLVAPLKRDPLAPIEPGHDPSPLRGVTVFPSVQDWRGAMRRLASHRGYAAMVVAILALGIAINTVIFTVADAALFRGFPYPNGGRIFDVYSVDLTGKNAFSGVIGGSAREWRTHTEIFEAFESWEYASFIAAGNTEPEEVGGAVISAGLFQALGVTPARGRLFTTDDAAARVVLISDGLWKRRFAADPDVLGKTLSLDDRPYTVVGVMPPHFRFPAAQQQVWLPMEPARANGPRSQTVALLKAGLTSELAQARIGITAAALQKERPQKDGWNLRLTVARAAVRNKSTRQALQVLTVAVLVVLLIACVNLANLSFAHALSRSRELSIRAALGASRWRLIRELLAEHLLLGAAGGLAGLTLAWWGVGIAIALAPAELTVWTPNEVRIDGRILAFTALATLGSALLFGILPAWKASRAQAGDALKSRTADAAVPHGRLRGTLVIAEVALSCILLTGAALLIRSFTQLEGLDPGFKPKGLLLVELNLPTDRYPAAARRALLEDLQRSIEGMPGVTAVTVSNGVPTSGSNLHFAELEAEGGTPETRTTVIPNTLVTPSYFATLGLPLLAGRTFTADDPITSTVISEEFARRLWPSGDALGKRFRMGARDEWRTVVGVATEVRSDRLVERDSLIEMYSPLWRPPATTPAPAAAPARPGPRSFAYTRVIVRAARPMDLAPAIKQAVWRIDPSQPVADAFPVEDVLAKSLSQERFAAVLMGTFAGLALVLAAAGLYGVLAQLVAQRRQEIGIRMALGAAGADVARLILGRGVALTAAGVAIGLAGAWAGARVLASQLFQVAPHDPLSFTLVPLALLAIALLASWLPTRRALSVDPASALRAE
jgi:putative ABC transport system permease protein